MSSGKSRHGPPPVGATGVRAGASQDAGSPAATPPPSDTGAGACAGARFPGSTSPCRGMIESNFAPADAHWALKSQW